ncbi:peptidase inhibitor family I36 protein [Paractinoplanes atraurantiacus]|uniref:Peptidase inhibitor family I36 n=1 Tax=Paractinoplanes atraurantiacus TaxID=1036182 RepID=A0A285HNS1_9ACTN|nr:peptidase inhibitor family I36 protein [Actinoplanes atraurantiacus]SNY37365.1 Peptidase inhibitor family I36 [Actinoplanes atraurantiacus]
MKAVLGSVLTVVASAAIAPSAAQAAPYQCGTYGEEICFYEHWDLTGSTHVFRGVKPGTAVLDFRDFTYTNGRNLNDSASSVVNLTSNIIVVYEHGLRNNTTAQAGRSVFVKPGERKNFELSGKGLLNDSASSLFRSYQTS